MNDSLTLQSVVTKLVIQNEILEHNMRCMLQTLQNVSDKCDSMQRTLNYISNSVPATPLNYRNTSTSLENQMSSSDLIDITPGFNSELNSNCNTELIISPLVDFMDTIDCSSQTQHIFQS